MADNLQNWQNATDNRFDFSKNAYLEAIPDLATANATAESAAQIQGANALNLGGLANTLTGRVGKFNGLQDQYATDAFGYNSPERQNQVADRAMTDVSQQFDNTQQQAQRQMSRMGVNPSSGRSLALTNQLGIAKAAAMAGAGSKARLDLDNIANERQKTAIGFGANLPNNITSLGQGSTYASNAAVNAAGAPLSNKLAFAGGISNIYGNAADGYKSIYSTLNLTPAQKAEQDRLAQADSNKNDSDWLNAIGKWAASDKGSSLIDKGWTALVG